MSSLVYRLAYDFMMVDLNSRYFIENVTLILDISYKILSDSFDGLLSINKHVQLNN